MLAKLSEGGDQPQVFSVLDLAGAFNQLLLEEELCKLLTLNTHKGLLSTKRLCFGIKTAPSIFQATMDKILVGIDNVFCYVDDVLIATQNKEDHVKVLEQVFERFGKHNVRLNVTKCQFFRPELKYLGHTVCKEGIRPIESEVAAISKAPRPTK